MCSTPEPIAHFGCRRSGKESITSARYYASEKLNVVSIGAKQAKCELERMQTIEATSVKHTRCIKRKVSKYAEYVTRGEHPSLPPPE